jgi:hypothetical protein
MQQQTQGGAPAAAVSSNVAASAAGGGGLSLELLCACWLLHSVLKYRRDAATAAMPVIAGALQALFAIVPVAAAATITAGGAAGAGGAAAGGAGVAAAAAAGGSQGLHNPVMALVRLAEAFGRVIRPMRYHAINVLAAALCALSQLQRALHAALATAAAEAALGSGATEGSGGAAGAAGEASGGGDPFGAVSEAVAPAVYALFEACTKKELQQLHLLLAPRAGARALLKTLHRSFEAEVKYRGKA